MEDRRKGKRSASPNHVVPVRCPASGKPAPALPGNDGCRDAYPLSDDCACSTGSPSAQIARLVLRSEDTVARVLKRFAAGGLDAIPRRTSPGRERTVTGARARRVGAGDRIGSSRGGPAKRQLDDRVAGRVSGSADRHYGHPRDGTCLLACPWICLQATHVDLTSAVPKRKPIMWEKTAGRGVMSSDHSI
jgi:hypothetical protein